MYINVGHTEQVSLILGWISVDSVGGGHRIYFSLLVCFQCPNVLRVNRDVQLIPKSGAEMRGFVAGPGTFRL